MRPRSSPPATRLGTPWRARRRPGPHPASAGQTRARETRCVRRRVAPGGGQARAGRRHRQGPARAIMGMRSHPGSDAGNRSAAAVVDQAMRSTARRWSGMALAILAVAALTGCNDYDDPRPPTGEGRSFAATRLVSVLIPWIVGGVALTWYHLSRPREGRPGRAAAIGSGLCFFVAIVLGVVALLAVAQLLLDCSGRPPGERRTGSSRKAVPSPGSASSRWPCR